MANIKLAALEARLGTQEPLESVVDNIIADDRPWLFRDHQHSYAALKAHLSAHLELDDIDSLIVGSAKCGFSLAPDTFGRPFSDASDIDIALISPALFDELWSAMLDWRYPWHTSKWHSRTSTWAVHHLEEHIAGFVDPGQFRVPMAGYEKIPREVRDRRTQWFDALRLAENIGPARGHSIHGRLYRSVNHLKRYMAWGLGPVRRRQQGEQQ